MLIGKGVCGNVIREIDDNGKPRAVKIFDLKTHDTGCNEAAIFLEVRPHRQFPRVQAISIDDQGRSFIRMEYFPHTLSDFIRCFPQEHLRYFLKEMLIALALLHEKRIIHGDVKPPNILMDDILKRPPLDKHRIALTDFSHSVRCYPEKGDMLPMPLTTATYRAYELAILDDGVEEYFCGTEVDLWSLGVIFYELISGKEVYRTFWAHFVENEADEQKVRIAGIQEMLESIDRDQPTILWRVGFEGESILHALLEKEPSKRPTALGALRSNYIRQSFPTTLPTFALLTRRTRKILQSLESALGIIEHPILRLVLEYHGLQEIPELLSRLYVARICSLRKELLLEFLPNILVILYYFQHSMFTKEILSLLTNFVKSKEARFTEYHYNFISKILGLANEPRIGSQRRSKKRVWKAR